MVRLTRDRDLPVHYEESPLGPVVRAAGWPAGIVAIVAGIATFVGAESGLGEAVAAGFVLIGCTFERKVNYLARQSLFRFPLGPMIRMLDAIPLDRDGLGLSGMKETLRRLRRGEPVLIFPEGTRSKDGEMGPLMPGVCALARRGRAPILPVGIAGAFDAWPRHRWIPYPTVVEVHVGEPIERQWIDDSDDSELLTELESRIRKCWLAAHATRQSRIH